MPNSVLAAATGLPKISRRSVLGGLAAATAAAATVTVAQAATPAEAAEPIQLAAPQANPELIALFGDLKAAVAEKAAAKDAKEWLVDEWRHLWPLAPDEITYSGFTDKSDESEVDLGGRPIVRRRETYARRVRGLDGLTRTVVNIEEAIERSRTEKARQMRQRRAVEWRHEHRLGEEYYGQIERVKEASGIGKANARIAAAHREISRLSKEIMASSASSLSCLAIKAEAVDIWCEATGYELKEDNSMFGWGYRFACDIRSVAPEGAS